MDQAHIFFLHLAGTLTICSAIVTFLNIRVAHALRFAWEQVKRAS